MSTTSAKWFFAKDTKAAKATGPVDDAQLKALVQSGQLESRDLIWRPGQTSWARAADIAGLFEATPPLPARPWPPFTASYARWFARASIGQRVAAVGISILIYQAIAAAIMGICFFVTWFQDMHYDLGRLQAIGSDTNTLANPRWDHRVEAIEDSAFASTISNYGDDGWDLAFARRVIDPGERPRYEVIMKRMKSR